MAQPPPPSTPSPAIRRIRVHRRRTPLRLLRHILARLLLFLFLLGLLISVLHPRYLTPPLIRSLSLSSPLSPPSLHLSPSSYLTRTHLYWTPVESISLLSLPPVPPTSQILLPASPSRLTFYLPDNSSASLALALVQHGLPPARPALLANQNSFTVPRFAAVSVAVVAPSEEATSAPVQLLEHADGLSAFAALHSALLGTLATGDPTLPFSALGKELRFATRYLAKLQHTRPVAVVIRGGRSVFGVVDGVFEGVRRLADGKKERRRREDGRTAAGVEVQAAKVS